MTYSYGNVWQITSPTAVPVRRQRLPSVAAAVPVRYMRLSDAVHTRDVRVLHLKLLVFSAFSIKQHLLFLLNILGTPTARYLFRIYASSNRYVNNSHPRPAHAVAVFCSRPEWVKHASSLALGSLT